MAVAKKAPTDVVDELEAYFAAREIAKAKAWMPLDDTASAKQQVNPLIGEIISMDIRTDGEYGDYPVVVIRQDSNDVLAVHAFHTLIKDLLANLEAAPGKRIVLEHLGVETSRTRKDSDGNPQKYHDYFGMILTNK